MGYTPYFLDVRRVDADTENIYQNNLQALRIDTGTANTTTLAGQGLTNKILKLQCNSADNGSIRIANGYIDYYSGGTHIFDGTIKYGTRTATGDVVCNGYMTILDSANNTVKLMTTA